MAEKSSEAVVALRLDPEIVEAGRALAAREGRDLNEQIVWLLVEALDKAGFDFVHLERVLFPPWTTEWISERGRRRLHDYGIAPPTASATAQCPQCGSSDTAEVSRFGSTPCKAQWRCNSCLEPFDRFKCH